MTDALDGGPVEPVGPIGRTVRAALGLGLLAALAWPVGRLTTFHEAAVTAEPMLYLLSAIAVFNLPAVVELGLGLPVGRQVQLTALALMGPLVGIDLLFWGRVWAPVFATYVLGLIVWVAGAMALGFLLAAVLATPGCELRAFADLAARLRGDRARPEPCPGALDGLDAWEGRWRSDRG